LGWIVVLVGAVVMRFTNFVIIDPIMSIGVAVFIFVNALNNLKEVLNLLLEKTPDNISVDEIKHHVTELKEVLDVHHIHVWSTDGQTIYATMHIVTNTEPHHVKHKVRDALKELGIVHSTLELEAEGEHRHEENCHVETHCDHGHHHHHHH
jgi:cobalt-zinc-cadmium efflux system protein